MNSGARGWLATTLEGGEVTWSLLLTRAALSWLALVVFHFTAMAFGSRGDDVFVAVAGAIAFAHAAVIIHAWKSLTTAWTRGGLKKAGRAKLEKLTEAQQQLVADVFSMLGGGGGVAVIVLTPELKPLLTGRILTPVGRGKRMAVAGAGDAPGHLAGVAYLGSHKLDRGKAYSVQPRILDESIRYYLCVTHGIVDHFEPDRVILKRFRSKDDAG